MTSDQLIFAYLVSMLAGISVVTIYYELRRKRFEPTPKQDNVFRCAQCGSVYTDDADVDRSRCPQCGKLNESFEF